MRLKRSSQMSIYEIFTEHKIADELDKISIWLGASLIQRCWTGLG